MVVAYFVLTDNRERLHSKSAGKREHQTYLFSYFCTG